MSAILETNLFTTRNATSKGLEENSIQDIIDTVNDENNLAKSLILTESYLITSVTRDSEQKITFAEIVYSNEVSGTISEINREGSRINSAIFGYGSDSFQVNFAYDESGYLETSSIVEEE